MLFTRSTSTPGTLRSRPQPVGTGWPRRSTTPAPSSSAFPVAPNLRTTAGLRSGSPMSIRVRRASPSPIEKSVTRNSWGTPNAPSAASALPAGQAAVRRFPVAPGQIRLCQLSPLSVARTSCPTCGVARWPNILPSKPRSSSKSGRLMMPGRHSSAKKRAHCRALCTNRSGTAAPSALRGNSSIRVVWLTPAPARTRRC